MTMIEALNADKILSTLTPNTRNVLAGLEILSTIDSTNTYLQKKSPLLHAYACLAEEQTAGRGRQNKYWHSPASNNIYFSLCWYFENIYQLTGLSLAIGVAVANALIHAGLPTVELKWPNDILFQQKKLGGILIETSVEQAGRCKTIIGIGINVDLDKKENKIDQPHTDIVSIIQKPAERNALVGTLLNELFSTLAIFTQEGLTPFLTTWQKYDVLLNKAITLLQQQNTITGIAMGIDKKGLLLVKCGNVIKTFHSGEVSVRFN